MQAIWKVLGVTVVSAAASVVFSDTGPAVANEERREVEITKQWSGQNAARDERKRVVVRDSASWKRLWRAMRGGTVPTPEAPEIDFQKHMVIGAFMGTRRTGGFTVRITRIAQNDKLVVSVSEQGPGPGDMVTMALTAPYHVVVVPRSEKPVEFVPDGKGQEPGRLRRPSRLPMRVPDRSDRLGPPAALPLGRRAGSS